MVYIYNYIYILYPTLSIWIRELSILFRSTALRLRRALGASRGELKSSSKMLPELSSQTLKRGLQGLLWDSEDMGAGDWWWWWWEMKRKRGWNEFEGFGEWISHGKVLDEWILWHCGKLRPANVRKWKAQREISHAVWLIGRSDPGKLYPLSAKLFLRFQGRFQDWFCSFDGSLNCETE